MESGEVYILDTSELNASILPVIVYAIGGTIIRTAITKVGTRLVLKIGSRSFYAVPASTVENATRNFVPVSYKTGNHTFRMTQYDIQHILARHHPLYWNGTTRSTQTFFHHNTSINQIRNIAIKIAKQNRTTLASRGTNGTYQVPGSVNGVKYTMGIKNGQIHQLYPR